MKLLVLLVIATVAGVLFTAGAIALGARSEKTTQPPAPQSFLIHITGQQVDRVLGANLVVRADQPIRVTIVNDSPMAHTFTVPALGIERVVLPGKVGVPSKTTFTLKAHTGAYSWSCDLPCGSMSKDHMGGEIYALLNPPLMHGALWAQAI
jgi:hypothetical protein